MDRSISYWSNNANARQYSSPQLSSYLNSWNMVPRKFEKVRKMTDARP